MADVKNASDLGRDRLGYVTNLLVTDGRRESLQGALCRRYSVYLRVSAHLGFIPKQEWRSVIHEIKYREDLGVPTPGKVLVDLEGWRKFAFGSTLRIGGGYAISDTVRQELEAYRPRNAYQPSWVSFDLDGVVYALGTMIALLSVDVDVSTKDLHGQGAKLSLMGMVKDEDIQAISTNAVFVPKNCGYYGSGRAFCAMVHAVHLAGGRVISDYVRVDEAARPIIPEMGGGLLAESVCEALGVLAYMYHSSARGDVFSLALVKGIHTVLTVVGHSDEGGFMRDVLRVGQYSIPYGGLPGKVYPWPGFGLPVRQDRCAIEEWVDSIAVVSAAAVAHCDPLVTVRNKTVPTVISQDDKDAAGKPLSDDDLFLGAKASISPTFMNFARQYTLALARCLGFTEKCDSEPGAAYGQLNDMFNAMTSSRHLHHPVLAPFFWTEPTGLLPRNAFGTEAEQLGYASLCGPNEQYERPYLEGAEPYGSATETMTQYALPYTNLRGLGGVLLCHGSAKDGMAQMYITQAQSDSFALARLSREEISTHFRENDLGVPLSSLAWVRGQSKIPHPAEALHLDEMVLLTVVHCKGEFSRRTFFENIPSAGSVLSSTITLSARAPRREVNGAANAEMSKAKRERTRAVAALAIVTNSIAQVVRTGNPYQCAREGTFHFKTMSGKVKPTPAQIREEGVIKTRDEREERLAALRTAPKMEIGHTAEEERPPAVKDSKGQSLTPTRVHDVIKGPQPARDLGGQTALPPPPQTNPTDGLAQQMGNINLNAGAQPATGAAPGGN